MQVCETAMCLCMYLCILDKFCDKLCKWLYNLDVYQSFLLSGMYNIWYKKNETTEDGGHPFIIITENAPCKVH